MDWSKVSEFKMGDKEVVKVYDNVHNKILWQKVAVQWLTLTADNDDNSISLASVADSDVEYAVDGGEWTSYDTATTLTGSKVEIRALNKTVTPVTFKGSTVTGNFKVSGYLDSVLDWKKLRDKKQDEITHATSCFDGMFDQNSKLTDCSGLVLPNIETLPDYCYRFMFRSCSNLKKAFTSITAKNFGVSSCLSMFNMSGITTGFALDNAETCTTSSFESMFDNCSLSSISATTFAKLKENTADMTAAMRYMFRGTKITTPMTTLPIKAVGKAMYYCMFLGTPITKAPTIMATGHNWSGVAAWTEGCMGGMFSSCAKLTTVQGEMYMTEAAGADFKDMFSSCFSLAKGTKFTKLTKVRTGGGSVFDQTYDNCTALTSNYNLPTTLGIGGTNTQMFFGTFYGCTSLVTPPDIPTITQNSDATSTTTTSMFRNMFNGCSKMTSLPAFNNKVQTGLQDNDCVSMFANCTSLTSIPANYMSSYTTCGTGTFNGMFTSCTALTTIGDSMMGTINVPSGKTGCFSYMFNKCTALTTLPTAWLKVTGNCTNYIFSSMFQGDTALVTFQGLDISTLTTAGSQVFSEMFSGCTKLTDVDLSVGQFTELGEQACKSMFNSCTALYYLPQLWFEKVTKVGNNCFDSMFYQCTTLAEPLVIKATTIGTNAYLNMYQGSGVYISDTEDEEYATPWYCYQGGYNIFNQTKGAYTGQCTTGTTYYLRQQAMCLKSESKTEFTFYTSSSANLQFSYDNNTWYDYSTSLIEVTNGVLYLRGKNNTAVSKGTDATQFELGSDVYDIQVSGQMTALLKYNIKPDLVEMGYRAFYRLFYNMSPIKNVAGLRINDGIIAENDTDTAISTQESGMQVYTQMFNTCKNLETAMDTFSRVGYQLYQLMFYGNTSLKYFGKDKKAYPTYTLNKVGYQQMWLMFQNCTSVTDAIKLTITEMRSGGLAGIYYSATGLKDASEFVVNAEVPLQGMLNTFYNCASLRVAPTLVLNNIGNTGCNGTFNSCQALRDASSVKIMGNIDYKGCCQMFRYAYYLLTPPVFDTITFVNSTTSAVGYQMQEMFRTCLNLEETPDLSKITNTQMYCFSMMFYEGSSLREITWKFPNTPQSNYCCERMFYYCNSLAKVPTDMLPSTTLEEGCYRQMFQACVQLHTVPNLPALTAGTQSYMMMFTSCFNLFKLPTIAATTMGTNTCYRMFYDSSVQVSATKQGEFTNAWTLKVTTVGTSSLANMFENSWGGPFTGTPTGTQTLYYKTTGFIKFKSATANTTLTFKQTATYANKLQTSTDNITYTDYTAGTAITGTEIYVRGIGNSKISGTSGSTDDATYPFTISGATDVILYGNANMLLDYTDNTNNDMTMGIACFRRLFGSQSSLKNMGYFILPNNSVSDYCYDNMFNNCTNIATNQNTSLPAQTVGSYAYRHMYGGCSNLTTSWRSVILAKNTSNYMAYYMYNVTLATCKTWLMAHARTFGTYSFARVYANCTKVTGVNKEFFLPLTDGTISGQNVCERIFVSCTGLTTLPAGLFDGITTLGVAEFSNAFNACTGLTTVNCTLPAVDTYPQGCFDNMFRDCSALTTVPENMIQCKVVGMQALRSLFYNTKVTSVKLDNITEIGISGCSYMFANNVSISKPIDFNPSVALNYSACERMYSGCTNLKLSATQTGDYTTKWVLKVGSAKFESGKVDGTTYYSSFNYMFASTGGTYTDSPTALSTTLYYVPAA